MLELHLAKSLKHKHLLKLTETTANDYDVDYNEKQIPTKEGKKQRPRKRQRFHCLLFEKIKIYDLTNMFMRLRHCVRMLSDKVWHSCTSSVRVRVCVSGVLVLAHSFIIEKTAAS